MIKSILEFFTELFRIVRSLTEKSGDKMVKSVAINSVMDNVVNYRDLNIERFLILSAHNGGDNMETFTAKYTSCRFEKVPPPFSPVKDNYQKLELDDEYLVMCRDIYINKIIKYDTAHMPDGMLRNIYEAEGVKHAYVFFIKHTKKEFVFGSIATSKDFEQFTSSEFKTEMKIIISKLKQLL